MAALGKALRECDCPRRVISAARQVKVPLEVKKKAVRLVSRGLSGAAQRSPQGAAALAAAAQIYQLHQAQEQEEAELGSTGASSSQLSA